MELWNAHKASGLMPNVSKSKEKSPPKVSGANDPSTPSVWNGFDGNVGGKGAEASGRLAGGWSGEDNVSRILMSELMFDHRSENLDKTLIALAKADLDRFTSLLVSSHITP
jgi:hypothetical protein